MNFRHNTLPYPGEVLKNYTPFKGGHNELSVSPDGRFIKKHILRNSHINQLNDDGSLEKVPIDKSDYMHREAAREEVASNIAHMGGLFVPQTARHSHDENGVTLISHYLKNSTPYMLHDKFNPDSPDDLLDSLDKNSVLGTIIFNNLINHRDTNLSNYLIHDNKLVPIDFGASFNQSLDEPFYVQGDNFIDWLNKSKDKPLDKALLSGYVKHYPDILKLVTEQIAPHYPSGLQVKVINDVKKRLDYLKAIYDKKTPKHSDLIDLLRGESPELDKTVITRKWKLL